jgi:hypothetical protein
VEISDVLRPKRLDPPFCSVNAATPPQYAVACSTGSMGEPSFSQCTPSCGQFAQAEETVKKLDLDGLVVIGGDDSNTNAAVLAEYFL